MRTIEQLVGSRVQQLRREQGMSANELARGIRFVRDAVYKIERGANPPAFATLKKLAALLKSDELDFFVHPEVNERHELIELTRKVPLHVLLEMKTACEAIATKWLSLDGKREAK